MNAMCSEIVPLRRGCSGRCLGVGCKSTPVLWVLAVCEGMISLFERSAEGRLDAVSPRCGRENRAGGAAVSSAEICEWLEEAAQRDRFQQLLLVGSAEELALMRLLLPEAVQQRIAAEIPRTLSVAWFRGTAEAERGFPALGREVERLLAH